MNRLPGASCGGTPTRTEAGVEAPVPAAIHPVRGPLNSTGIIRRRLLVIAFAKHVPAPLRHVAVHVEQAEAIGPLLAHGVGVAVPVVPVAAVPTKLTQARRFIAK